MLGCEHGKFLSLKNAVAVFLRTIPAADQLFMLLPEAFQLLLVGGFGHLDWMVVNF